MKASRQHTYQTLAIRADGPVDHLTLNRPDQFNAICSTMLAELHDYFSRLDEDESVRVVVLRGAGRHFCAGLDLKDPANLPDTLGKRMRMQRSLSKLIVRMRRCPQPIVAVAHGAASGGGFALALASDVRFAAEDARFNVAMARIGMTGCDVGISYFLPRAIGPANAAELMMGGRFLAAQKALRVGLVSEVAPREDLEPLVAEMVADMVQMSPLGLRLTKEALNMSQDAGSLEAVIAMEDRQQVLCMEGFMEEGVAAFLEKRPAVYPDA
jgi:enoyl-CoA hydratase